MNRPSSGRHWSLPRRKWNGFWAQKRIYAEDLSDVEEIPFKGLLVLLGIVGALPFTWQKPHYPSRHPTKSTLFLSVVVYLILFVVVYRAISNYGYRLVNEDLPPYVAITFFSYLALCFYVVSTVAIIADVRGTQRALRLWTQLNVLYRKITNEAFVWHWQTTEKGLLFTVTFLAPMACAILKNAVPVLQLQYEDFLPALHTCATNFSICTLWIAFYVYLEVFAKNITKALSENIEQGSLTSDKLRLYQDTWIMIKKFSDAISSLNAPFLSLIASLVYVILATFQFILLLQAGLYPAALSVLFFGSSVLIFMSTMARASDLAIAQIKVLFSVLLAQLDVYKNRSVPQYQIIHMFLGENVRTVTPTYGGFVCANKALIPSLFVAVTMNVVVLAQFTQARSS